MFSCMLIGCFNVSLHCSIIVVFTGFPASAFVFSMSSCIFTWNQTAWNTTFKSLSSWFVFAYCWLHQPGCQPSTNWCLKWEPQQFNSISLSRVCWLQALSPLLWLRLHFLCWTWHQSFSIEQQETQFKAGALACGAGFGAELGNFAYSFWQRWSFEHVETLLKIARRSASDEDHPSFPQKPSFLGDQHLLETFYSGHWSPTNYGSLSNMPTQRQLPVLTNMN